MTTLPTALNVLPPVAKSFYTFCKKCDADRYHKVLAHTTATSAKIECEVCHSKKTYSLPKAQTRKTTGGTTTRRSSSEAQRKSNHQSEYQGLLDSVSKDEMITYSIKTKFTTSSKINHPKFGLGIVKSVQPDKIEVVFSDEIKTLVHNRT